MSTPLGESSPKRDASHPDPIADPERVESLRNVVQDETMTEGATIPGGIPFPAAVGNPNVIPAINISSDPTLNEKDSPTSPSDKPPMVAKRSSSLNHRARSSNDHEKPASPPSSSSVSDEKSGTITKQKKKGFFAKKSKKEQDEKKDKEKEEEANAVPPVSFFGLYRYMTWPEKLANLIGVIFACAAGAAQPLMTLIFGRLTESFTVFSQTVTRVAEGDLPFSALQEARDTLKSDSGKNALYLMAIGIGMVSEFMSYTVSAQANRQFIVTWGYMYIWSVTGEVNAKRIREKYLSSVLRQEVSGRTA